MPLRSLIYSSGEKKRGGDEAEGTGFVPRPAEKSADADDNAELSWAFLPSKSGMG